MIGGHDYLIKAATLMVNHISACHGQWPLIRLGVSNCWTGFSTGTWDWMWDWNLC